MKNLEELGQAQLLMYKGQVQIALAFQEWIVRTFHFLVKRWRDYHNGPSLWNRKG